MKYLSEAIESINPKDRVIIEYKCGSIHTGRISKIGGVYICTYNARSLGGTVVQLDRVKSIRYKLSRVRIWKALTA